MNFENLRKIEKLTPIVCTQHPRGEGWMVGVEQGGTKIDLTKDLLDKVQLALLFAYFDQTDSALLSC